MSGLVLGLVAAPSTEAWAAARPHGKVWTPPKTPGVSPGKPVKGKNQSPGKLPAPKYPVPADWKAEAVPVVTGSATVTLGDDKVQQAGKLPVKVARGGGSSAHAVKVEVAGGDKGKAAGTAGPVVALTGTDAGDAGKSVKVALDLKALQGSGWSDRSQLVALPACALTDPQAAECRTQTSVASAVDAGGVLTAEVTLPSAEPARSAPGAVKASLVQGTSAAAAPMVLAATTGASGAGGSYTATSLNPSANWGAGTNTGGFGYGYAIQVPAALGGGAPTVSLSYDSSSVDGKNSAQNAQSSWIGEGWDYQPGFIERSYKNCDKDGITGSGDLCWGGQNATLSLGAHSGTLVRDDSTGVWHLQGDDGSKIEQLTGAPNGLNNGEYWKVTTTDGTQYWFGQNHLPGGDGTDPAAGSAWGEPVYAPNSGDPCYNSGTGKASWCTMGWRWNLDYVVDTHQNLTTYAYATESNSYSRGGGQNNGSGTLTSYVRAGYPTGIAYGQRLPEQIAAKGAAKPAAKVQFSVSERCLPNGTITCSDAQRTTANQASWPDVPLDLVCAASGTCTNYSPSFFSTKRLTGVSTQVLVDGAYRTVDSWELKHSFPTPGDGTKPALWLASVQHTGSNGQSGVALPAVSFTARELPNRVDGLTPAQPAFNRPRIQQITTETGGQINVVYADPECSRVAGRMPSAEDANTMACMPVHWYLPGQSATDPVKDWFNKYLVTSVTEQDAVTGTALTKSTDYSYGGGAAWHRNDNEFTDPKLRTWDGFRGYRTVTTTTGSGNSGEAPRTQQVVTYLRGMDGDYKADGSRRAVTDTTPLGATVTDSDWLAGALTGTESYDRAGGKVVAVQGASSGNQQVTATHKQSGGMPDLVARYAAATGTNTGKQLLADGSWRTVTSSGTSDPANGNRQTQVADQGDGTAATPPVCTTTSYASATNPMLLALVSEKKVVAGPCGTAATAATTLSDVRTLYDGKPFGQAGDVGEPTGWQTLDHFDAAGAPVYVSTGRVTSSDVYGRTLATADSDGSTYDAAGNQLSGATLTATTATTAYTPATGALATKVTQYGAMGPSWSTTVTQDPGRGLPLTTSDINGHTTTQQYDALGRLTAVWRSSRATSLSPSLKFGYAINGVSAPSVVTTESLLEDNTYARKTELYDGLGRLRQTQTSPATGGAGRLITDAVVDSHGWTVKSSAAYYEATTQPNGTVFAPQDSQVPAQTWTTYDGLGRPVTSAFVSYGQQQWATTTAYPGADRTDVTPPQGATPTSTVTDARGRTVQLWQYHGATATGRPADADVTSYAFTAAGQPASRTDAAGNTWSSAYDVRGRLTSSQDPDSGLTSYTYDAESRPASITGAKGDTLLFTYDLLGRRTGSYSGSIAPANQLAAWSYDTVAKGQPASSTRYTGGAAGSAYTQTVTGYDAEYRPLGVSVTIPAAEGALAGTYTTANQYSPILGSLTHTDLPAVGGLPAEGVDYLYSNTGLMIASGGNSTLVTDVQYDALGRPTRTTVGDWGNQVVSTQQYDWATARVVNSFLDRQTGTTSLDQVGYTYNPAGRITSISDRQDGGATDTQCFTADHLGRLTNAWTDTAGTGTAAAPSVPGIGGCRNAGGPAAGSVGGPSPYWQSYGYDLTGNRTSLVQHDLGGNSAKDVTTTQTFGAPKSVNTPTTAPNTGGGTGGPHALLGTSTTGPAGTTATAYQYDAAGNTTAITDTTGTTNLTWGVDGQLASLARTGQAGGTSYLYDADGAQLIRRDPGTTTLDLGVDELTLDTASGSLSDLRTYPAPGGLSVSRVTAATGGGKLVYQAADQHGTNGVQIDTDAAQTVTRRPTDPFGNPRGTQPAAGSWSGDKGFVGGTKDDATGLTNLGAREYDPVHGRFLNPDPIVNPSEPQQWNAYAYSNNNPIDYSDPSGLSWKSWLHKAGNAIGATASGYYHAAVDEVSQMAEGWDRLTGDTEGADRLKYERENPHSFMNGTTMLKNLGGDIDGPQTKSRWYKLGGWLESVFGPVPMPSPASVETGAVRTAEKVLIKGATKGATKKLTGALTRLAEKVTGKCLHSFPADTRVLMADGSAKPIGAVRIGDEVATAGPVTGEHTARPVTDTITTPDDRQFTRLTVSTGTGERSTLTVTAHHPFWDATTGRWTDAADLRAGDHLATPDGSDVTVTAVDNYTTAPTEAHDLTVADLHTYYVLAGGTPVLVHNCEITNLAAHGEQPKCTISSVCEHIVLGIKDRDNNIGDFATGKGAHTFNGDPWGGHDVSYNGPMWMAGVEQTVSNPGTRISIVLDGMEGSTAIEKFVNAYKRGMIGGKAAAPQSGSGTNWEMSVVGRAVRMGDRDWLQNMDFYLNGAKVNGEMKEPDWATITPGLKGYKG
ncbi:polymorphic toxin-type HINT domain-containing protein [Kitasatospora paracochleata]|uniref:RHS repeat-associated protein n=1 Tax=Kitasatospora paracochleata TaxID=58354 RepID=A0ABT1IYA4_9ACTN|nr:polymorphic toxin-type HINT domain-containing protein [Kitasatospora paracochleata]MCP2309929.1 RHS repeat-associated protein [Kitasatospora paracochleata]